MSWNCGAEGETHDEEVLQLRERQKRNMLASLLLSQGTPMLLAGDEFGRTQTGNNNTYCQDNDLNWLDWSGIGQPGSDLLEFTKQVIRLRSKSHLLHNDRYYTGHYDDGVKTKDATWLSPAGIELNQQQWDDASNRCFGVLLDGRATTHLTHVSRHIDVLLFVANAHHDLVMFTLPQCPGGTKWLLQLDTNQTQTQECDFEMGAEYGATGRSLLLFSLIQDN